MGTWLPIMMLTVNTISHRCDFRRISSSPSKETMVSGSFVTVNGSQSSTPRKHSLQLEAPSAEFHPTEASAQPLKRLRVAYESFTKSQKNATVSLLSDPTQHPFLLSTVYTKPHERSAISADRDDSDHRLARLDLLHHFESTWTTVKNASEAQSRPHFELLKTEDSLFDCDDKLFHRSKKEPDVKKDHNNYTGVNLWFGADVRDDGISMDATDKDYLDLQSDDSKEVFIPQPLLGDAGEELLTRSFLQPRIRSKLLERPLNLRHPLSPVSRDTVIACSDLTLTQASLIPTYVTRFCADRIPNLSMRDCTHMKLTTVPVFSLPCAV